MSRSTSSQKNLVEQPEFRKHLTHHYAIDPNRIIFDEFSRLYGADYAQKFLRYREDFARVNSTGIALPWPITVNIGVINACNLRCIHCYRQYRSSAVGKIKLDREEITRVIDQCSDLGVPAMLFGTECEHLLHPAALDIIEYACARGIIDVFLATNGILLTKAATDRILTSRLTRLTVSLDACSAETYRKVRGGDFRTVLENLEYFLDARKKAGKRLPVLRVTFVRLEQNRHEEEGFCRFWQNKADIIDVQSFMDVRNINNLKHKSIDMLNCVYPWNMLYVSWDGSYKPCCSEFCKYLNLGNIAHSSIAEIWCSEALQDLRCAMRDKTRFPVACINCLQSLSKPDEYPDLPALEMEKR